MSEKNEKIIIESSVLFDFTNSFCDCAVDTTHPQQNMTEYTFRLYPKESQMIRFAYVGESGLVRLNAAGTIDSKPVLSELLAVPSGNIKALESFIKNFGFFLPINSSENNSLNSEVLFGLIDRIKATVDLMSAIGEPQADYKKILGLTIYLLLEKTIEIKFPNYTETFITCPHDMSNVWNGVYLIDEVGFSSEDEEIDFQTNEAYKIKDTIYPPSTLLDINEYADVVSRSGGMDLSRFSNNVIYLFRNAVGATISYDCRLAIDFLYHFSKEIGNIQSWNHKGELTFAESASTIAAKFKNNLSDAMKIALMTLAKVTLKSELEYNLSIITPSYNTDTMSPSWQIPNLLSGLYFSIFYMRPNVELYRHCANPTCTRSFLIKTTSSKQKYCTSSCANAAAQRQHRRKVKEKAGK